MIAVTTACRGCGACLLTCPERAIRPAVRDTPGAGPLTVLEYRCTGCGECIEVCPVDAIEFTSAFEFVSCVSSEAKGEGETA
jgi:electron transport complex protein RnfB